MTGNKVLSLIGLATKAGTEVLIHVGIDTVKLDGDGFQSFVKQGDEVKTGDVLVKADLEKIRAAGYSTQTMMILPELEDASVEPRPAAAAKAGDPAVVIRRS